MDAKLIKTEVNYLLKNEEGVIIASTSLINLGLALSVKNCQAIELGYNLDELALEVCDCEANECEIRDEFKKGFQKALEILGDKKFTKEDMIFARDSGYDNFISEVQFFDKLDMLTQQTEFAVEIVMEQRKVLVNGYKNQPTNIIGFVAEYENQLFPKLDADGNLILKRKV